MDISPQRSPGYNHQPFNTSKQQRPQLSHKAYKKRCTHFLCLPLVTDTSIPQLIKSLDHFRQVVTTTDIDNDVQNDSQRIADHSTTSTSSPLQVIPAIAHGPPGTFHLTLGVMDLSKLETMNRAVSLLQGLDYRAILTDIVALTSSPTPSDPKISISLIGLSTFPPTQPTAARVLYAKPYDSLDTLHPFAVHVRQKFRAAGLITETRPLVLHATAVNLRYATQSARGRRGRGDGRQGAEEGMVDARTVVEVFDRGGGFVGDGDGDGGGGNRVGGEYVWAEGMVVDRVAIFKLGAVVSEKKGWGLEYPPIAEKMV